MTDSTISSLDPYSGEPLVPAESFLRRLPVTLDLAERLRIDAIVIASDILTQAFGALREFSSKAATDIDAIGNAGRAFAIGQCWTIVDQLHAVRQLVQQKGHAPGPYSLRFLDLSQPATELRNRMDHLSSNLSNLGSAKGSRSALFGSLSFFVAKDVPPTGGHILMIMSGAIHEKSSMPLSNPAGKTLVVPVDLFTLTAFGTQLEFGSVLSALQSWVAQFEMNVEKDVREQVAAYSEQSGVPIENLMQSMGGGLAIAIAVDFSEAAQKTVSEKHE